MCETYYKLRNFGFLGTHEREYRCSGTATNMLRRAWDKIEYRSIAGGSINSTDINAY